MPRPSRRLVAAQDILVERHVGVVLDGDLVVVVDHHQVAQFLGAGQRGCFRRDAFLQVTVRSDHKDVVVERRGAGSGVGVEQAARVALAVGEAHRGSQTLAEGAGGDLHTGGVAVFGVAGDLGAPGAQGLDVVHFQAVTGEEQLQVQREGGVAGGEDKTVTAGPTVIAGIMAHDLLEQHVSNGGQGHGGAGVTVAHLLHGVCGEYTRGVHGAGVLFGPVQRLLKVRHGG